MPLRKLLSSLLAICLLPAGLPAQAAPQPAAQAPAATISPAIETPAEYAGRKLALQEMLQRLTTTGRIMQVVAHPDDEDGSMLTLESRVKGNTAMLFTFTRGEGGQNAQGAVFFDELGILRTLELLAADKEYGAEERFSHVADFGFSKSAEESYAKWGGRDVPLADLVSEIRQFQPDVLVARFSGTPKDGHGHHQASAQMTIQAFHDAADPKRFSNSLISPWQPLKLYTGLAGDQATLVPDEGQPSPLLDGKTPQEVALHGLRHQLSQGAGNWKGPFPKIYSSYKLVDSAKGVTAATHESDFFEGIDTSLPGLADRFPKEAAEEGAFKPAHGPSNYKAVLTRVAASINQARAAAQSSPEDALDPLLKAQQALASLAPPCAGVCIPGPLESRRLEKMAQLAEAIRLAAGINSSLERTDASTPFVIPGESVRLRLRVANYGHETIAIRAQTISAAESSATEFKIMPNALAPGMATAVEFSYKVPLTTAITRAPFERKNPIRDSTYAIKDAYTFEHFALAAAPIRMSVLLEIAAAREEVTAIARVSGSPLFIAPPVSVTANPAAILRRLNQSSASDVEVGVQNNSANAVQGEAALQVPDGWSRKPLSEPVDVASGKTIAADFGASWPAASASMQSTLSAELTAAGKTYSEGYHLIARADLPDAFPYYAPAQTTISLIHADIPDKHNIGYVMGVGDTLPEDLTSLGFTVHLLSDEDLASGDLHSYDTIVTGIRAYGARAALRDHNSRLLDYVKNGGTLVVQYEQDNDGFNRGHFTPYPAVMGKDRVSQEEQPVTMLDADAPVFRYPNRITPADFDGWVQERGLYFMKEWSPEYTPLLSMHDTGEAPLQGGLLLAHYGKGTYIFTGLSFFRELPNGVPGATRLFINLLGAGHNPAEQPVTSAAR